MLFVVVVDGKLSTAAKSAAMLFSKHFTTILAKFVGKFAVFALTAQPQET